MAPLAERLRAEKPEIERLISEALLTDVFSHRFTLHPRRLAELAAEEAAELLSFMESGDEERIAERGRLLADQGVGDGPLLSLPAVIRRFAGKALRTSAPELLEEALGKIERYGTCLTGAFMRQRIERTLADQELLRRALSTALETQSRELLSKDHAISTSINGIILAGLDERVTYGNPAFLSLWGFASVEEVIGTPLRELWAGDEAKAALEALPTGGGWRGELTGRRRDGTTMTVSLAVSLVKDGSGQPIGIMASSVDMTEARRLQTQMQQVQKMDALGQLAGGIAHDFNNLLTVISGHLQLLALEVDAGTQIHQDILQITAAVERGAGLTRQLRYFTRQATGKRQRLNLNDVARETYDLLRRTFPPEISIAFTPDPVLWAVEADPNQMSQVLVNLCVNARDAILEKTGTGKTAGGTLMIRTENVELANGHAGTYIAVDPGRYVRLRVSDTGVGIPADLRDELFVPFVTTKEPKSGTGLGLAVVYGIVRSHKGTIEVESRPGEGSTFSVYLPVVERAAEEAAEAPPPSTLASGAGTVLVVDDEAQVRTVMARTLGRCGYRVIEAGSGKTALGILESRGDEIHLVVLDVVMPEMEGREVFKRLRRMRPRLPVLFVTGHTMDPSEGDLTFGGRAGLLEKPLDLKLFSETVQAMLGKACREP